METLRPAIAELVSLNGADPSSVHFHVGYVGVEPAAGEPRDRRVAAAWPPRGRCVAAV